MTFLTSTARSFVFGVERDACHHRVGRALIQVNPDVAAARLGRDTLV